VKSPGTNNPGTGSGEAAPDRLPRDAGASRPPADSISDPGALLVFLGLWAAALALAAMLIPGSG
jgi:hypothetical protein